MFNSAKPPCSTQPSHHVQLSQATMFNSAKPPCSTQPSHHVQLSQATMFNSAKPPCSTRPSHHVQLGQATMFNSAKPPCSTQPSHHVQLGQATMFNSAKPPCSTQPSHHVQLSQATMFNSAKPPSNAPRAAWLFMFFCLSQLNKADTGVNLWQLPAGNGSTTYVEYMCKDPNKTQFVGVRGSFFYGYQGINIKAGQLFRVFFRNLPSYFTLQSSFDQVPRVLKLDPDVHVDRPKDYLAPVCTNASCIKLVQQDCLLSFSK
ncbi:hypothetical protein MTO96_025002 [Rhipicephalus appendiculatus]